jgi:hypothetical protein
MHELCMYFTIVFSRRVNIFFFSYEIYTHHKLYKCLYDSILMDCNEVMLQCSRKCFELTNVYRNLQISSSWIIYNSKSIKHILFLRYREISSETYKSYKINMILGFRPVSHWFLIIISLCHPSRQIPNCNSWLS